MSEIDKTIEPQTDKIKSPYYWGMAFAIVPLLVGIWVVFFKNDTNMNEIIHSNPYKIIFIAGIIISVFVQTSVEGFLNNNKLYAGYEIPFQEFISKGSNILLTGAAVLSIITINKFYWHVFWSISYMVILLIVDCYFYYYSNKESEKWDSTNKNGEINNAKLCSMVCLSVATKIDLLSLLGLAVMAFLSIVISNESKLSSVSKSLNDLNQRTHMPAEASQHNVMWNKLLTQNTNDLEKISESMPDLFFSGAVGVHLIATMILLMLLMRDWTKKLVSEKKKVLNQKNGGAGVPEQISPDTHLKRP
jgi:hypothetical protein